MQLSAVFLPWGHLQKGFPVSCRLCAGVPFGNVEGQNYFQRNSVSAVNPVNENLGSQLSHFFCGNVYGGQHGREILGGFDVIHTNDRNIIRYPFSRMALMAPMAVLSLAQKMAVMSDLASIR